jgi:hypothetical protein
MKRSMGRSTWRAPAGRTLIVEELDVWQCHTLAPRREVGLDTVMETPPIGFVLHPRRDPKHASACDLKAVTAMLGVATVRKVVVRFVRICGWRNAASHAMRLSDSAAPLTMKG